MMRSTSWPMLLALLVIAGSVLAQDRYGRERYDDRAYDERRYDGRDDYGRRLSARDCDIIARREARDAGGLGDGRMVRGSVRGAIVGGILGGSRGAKRGAALGLIAGGARQARARDYTYDRVFDDCMRGYTRY